MNFLHNDLGHLHGGEIVEVTLSHAANVRLMDSNNFSSYRSGRQHRYFGGHITRTPFRVQVPHSGHWHVAVDTGGGGSVRAGIRLVS
jgi:hypothetical protein